MARAMRAWFVVLLIAVMADPYAFWDYVQWRAVPALAAVADAAWRLWR